MKQNKRYLNAISHGDETVVCGTWQATQEYNAVLEAVNTLATYATQSYCIQLHNKLDELNR